MKPRAGERLRSSWFSCPVAASKAIRDLTRARVAAGSDASALDDSIRSCTTYVSGHPIPEGA